MRPLRASASSWTLADSFSTGTATPTTRRVAAIANTLSLKARKRPNSTPSLSDSIVPL